MAIDPQIELETLERGSLARASTSTTSLSSQGPATSLAGSPSASSTTPSSAASRISMSRRAATSSTFACRYRVRSSCASHSAASASYFYNGAQQFRALEAIRLHSVAITGETDISEMFARCPSVRTLDLRNCRGKFVLLLIRRIGDAMSTPVNLRSVTFAKCEGDIRLGDIGVVNGTLNGGLRRNGFEGV
jgi:hypothetical protein